ncbi:MAG: serine hydrolase domain-containing protein, partial [Pseudomonadota bacterium]
MRPVIALLLLCLAGCANQASNRHWLNGDTRILPAVKVRNAAMAPSLAEQMRRHKVPGVSIALIIDNKITDLSSVGLKEQSSDTQLNSDLLFQAASISKPVSALGIMVLIDEGKLSLDTPANDVLRDWKILPPNKQDPVTIRELLAHTAGISVRSYPGFERGAERPTTKDILLGAPNAYSEPVEFEGPKGAYRYSGGGYMILQKIIEDVSGMPFNTFMREKVFAPAGATMATFNILNDTDQVAFGHNWSGLRRNDPWQDYPQSAAAGLWATPKDLAKLMIVYGKAYSGETDAFISPDSARAMATLVTDYMGLGFGVHGNDDGLHLSHAGWTIGYRAYLLYFPERGDGAVIMTNADGGHTLIDDILRTLGAERNWPGFGVSKTVDLVEWPSEKKARLAGTYHMSPAAF